MSRDPVMGMVGSQAIRWNPYAYAGANPTNYVDPSGRIFWLPLLILGAKFLGAVAAGFAIGYGTGRVVDAGFQLLFTGHVDWTQNHIAGIESGILGAIMGPFGMAIHAMSARALAAGVSKAVVRRVAFGLGFAIDVGIGTAWDARVRGGEFGYSFLTNLVGGGAGELAGYALGRLWRGARHVIEKVDVAAPEHNFPWPKLGELGPGRYKGRPPEGFTGLYEFRHRNAGNKWYIGQAEDELDRLITSRNSHLKNGNILEEDIAEIVWTEVNPENSRFLDAAEEIRILQASMEVGGYENLANYETGGFKPYRGRPFGNPTNGRFRKWWKQYGKEALKIKSWPQWLQPPTSFMSDE